MNDEPHFLDTVKWSMIPVVNYQGVEVWKLKKGYKVLGRVVNSVGEVDEVLGKARKAVEMSVSDKIPESAIFSEKHPE